MTRFSEKPVGPTPRNAGDPVQGLSVEVIVTRDGDATTVPPTTAVMLALDTDDIGLEFRLHRRDRAGQITDAQRETIARCVPAMADRILIEVGAIPTPVGAGSHPRPSAEEQELPYEVQQSIVDLFKLSHGTAESTEHVLARYVRNPGLVYTLWEHVSYHGVFESATLETLAKYVADVMLAHRENFIKMNLRAVASLLAHLPDDDPRFATIVRLVDGTQIVNVVLYYEREEYIDANDALIPAIEDTAALTAIALDPRQEDDTRACAIRHISDRATLSDLTIKFINHQDSDLLNVVHERLQQL